MRRPSTTWPATKKKPKIIVRRGSRASRVVVRPRNPLNRYKCVTTISAPGGVGHLRLVIRGR